MRSQAIVALFRGRRAALLLVATVAMSGLVLAQPQQPIRVGTNFVRVDVYPTKDGRVVDGLQAADFEVLEDGVPQKIDTFEHVMVARGPQTARTEPSSQRDMVRALANPRARVFLIFLDAPYVTLESSHAINEPLIRFMTNFLADEDLVGIMTPGMSAPQVAFGKKTTVIEEGLRRNWNWGRQGQILDPELDRQQIQYEMCFPGAPDVGKAMAARSRERATLEALQDAVRYLSSIREERKAFVAVTQGWILYREDPDMMRPRKTEPPSGIDKVRAGPTGQLTIEDRRNQINMLGVAQCDADRQRLAAIDNDRFLREIIDDANRGNASFYMIDPSGLTMRRADRTGAMRTLADNTDGFAVLNSNDLNRGFERIDADMSSYYLLGYYAANSKLDGRFREITVRVREPGVVVRARKGYRAPTAAEVAEARNRPDPAPVAPGVTTVQAAIDQLGRIRPGARFRIDAVVGPGPRPSMWVVGELASESSRPDEFSQGARAAIEASGSDKSTNAMTALKPGEIAFVTRLDAPAAGSGTLDVRVRLTSAEGAGLPLTESVRLDLAESKPVMFRRGPTTGPRMVPAASPVFSRTERVRLDFPVGPAPGDKPGSGRVLDRGGTATQIPVAVSERTDEGTAQRWIAAELSLAALSPGDYAVEVVIVRESGESRVLTPIRVGR
jgi:VWFA-related protein